MPEIRVRVCLAVVEEGRILLVPHFDTDAGDVQWNLPGGRLEFGERLEEAAVREFEEETGLTAETTGLLDVSEVVLPDRPWHSITVTYRGRVTGGELRAEPGHDFGEKTPRWFGPGQLTGPDLLIGSDLLTGSDGLTSVSCHPEAVILRALEL